MFDDGTELALLYPHDKLMKENPELPSPIEIRVITYRGGDGAEHRLFTTLIDPDEYRHKRCSTCTTSDGNWRSDSMS